MTTYSDNVRIPHLDPSVAEPEIPENTAKNIIDKILTATYVLNATVDADITITHTDDPTGPTDWQSFIIEITDTGVVLTIDRNVILPDNQRPYILKNSTAVGLTFKTSAGTGFLLGAGQNAYGYSDGTNIEKLEFAAEGAGATWVSLTDTPIDFTTSTGIGWIPKINAGQSALDWFDLPTELGLKLDADGDTLTNATMDGGDLANTTTNLGIITGGTITSMTVKNYGEASAILGVVGTITLDIANGNVFTCTPTGIITFIFSTTHTNTSFTLLVTNFGAFTHDFTTNQTVKWEGGIEPSWSVSGDDLITFTKIGSVWIGGALIGVA